MNFIALLTQLVKEDNYNNTEGKFNIINKEILALRIGINLLFHPYPSVELKEKEKEYIISYFH